MTTDLSIKLYEAIRDSDVPREYKHWHASSIAECPRAHYFRRLGVPALERNKPSGAKLLRWQAGHHLEAAIRPYITQLYDSVTSNKRLTSKELDLTGEYDNLSVQTLIEIKSVDDYAFIERDGVTSLKETDGHWPNGQNKWKPKSEPYLHHLLQNHAYVLLLAEQGIKVENIDFVYLALKGRIVTYRAKVEEYYLNNVKMRLKTLNEAWEQKKPPVCICNPEHELWGAVMQWCDYRTEDGCCDYLSLIKEKAKVGADV